MLVLTRGIGEGLMIGDDICVTVERISGGVIRIGIAAPRDAVILRGEMVDRPTTNSIEDAPRSRPDERRA